MKVTGMNEIHADSRDVVAEILADDFQGRVKAAILESGSMKEMGIKRFVIEKAEIYGTQYSDGDPIGTFLVTVSYKAKKYKPNSAIYKVYIVGGGRKTIDTAYFQTNTYITLVKVN